MSFSENLEGVFINMLYRSNIHSKVYDIINMNNTIRNSFPVYNYETNYINQLNDDCIKYHLWESSNDFYNNKEFRDFIRKHVEYYSPRYIKYEFFKKAYINSIDNKSDIDAELNILYENVSEEDTRNIAYFSLIASYVNSVNFLT